MTAEQIHLAAFREGHDLFRSLESEFLRVMAEIPRPVEPEPMHVPVTTDEE